MLPFITVRHNIEVAHRLYELAGKCENIHGHSMWVDLKIYAALNATGVAGGLEFGAVKKAFRTFLDETFDHHLLLNESDPWAQGVIKMVDLELEAQRSDPNFASLAKQLPGLMVMPQDPTTENLAKWIAQWADSTWHRPVEVVVHETSVNAAGFAVGVL